MPEWLDLALRICGAVLLIGGIMWLALRRPPARNPDASHDVRDYSGSSGDTGSDGGGHGGH